MYVWELFVQLWICSIMFIGKTTYLIIFMNEKHPGSESHCGSGLLSVGWSQGDFWTQTCGKAA